MPRLIDWTVPQPSYEDLHAKQDELHAQLNAAVAEARQWQARLLRMQRERDQALATIREAERCVAGWEMAYAALLREFWKVCEEHADAKWWREHHEEMRRLESSTGGG